MNQHNSHNLTSLNLQNNNAATVNTVNGVPLSFANAALASLAAGGALTDQNRAILEQQANAAQQLVNNRSILQQDQLLQQLTLNQLNASQAIQNVTTRNIQTPVQTNQNPIVISTTPNHNGIGRDNNITQCDPQTLTAAQHLLRLSGGLQQQAGGTATPSAAEIEVDTVPADADALNKQLQINHITTGNLGIIGAGSDLVLEESNNQSINQGLDKLREMGVDTTRDTFANIYNQKLREIQNLRARDYAKKG